MRLFIIYLLFNIPTWLLCQNKDVISLEWKGSKSPEVSIHCPQWASVVFYTNVENYFYIDVHGMDSKDIAIELDSSALAHWIEWYPQELDRGGFTISEAKSIKAFTKTEEERFQNTAAKGCDKRHYIKAKEPSRVKIKIYDLRSEPRKLIHTLYVSMTHPPKASLQISDLEFFKAHQRLEPILEDFFPDAASFYKIVQYQFTAYNKSNNPVFSQTVNGNFITHEIENFLKRKKYRQVVVSNIRSKYFTFQDIKLLNN